MKSNSRTNRQPKAGRITAPKRILASLLCLFLIATTILPQTAEGYIKTKAASHTLQNPTKDSDGNVIWDCVWFGNYWQSDATGKTKEPIKWRVLSVNGNDAFLLADKNLDGGIPYNEEYTSVTWETCTMRSWLNSTFINNAFSVAEQNAIKETVVVNNDNPEYGTEGGNNTRDKLYLLSIEEAMNPQYGFTDSTASTDTRKAINTAYTAGKSGMSSAGSSDWWWLRSPGKYTDWTADVRYDGYLDRDGWDVDDYYSAVRPALHLNLSSSSSLYSYAGTVSSKGTMDEEEPGHVSGGGSGGGSSSTTTEESVPGKVLSISEYNSKVSVRQEETETVSIDVKAESEEQYEQCKNNISAVSADEGIFTVEKTECVDDLSLTGQKSGKIEVTVKGVSVGDADLTVSCGNGEQVTAHITVLSKKGKQPIPVTSTDPDEVADAIDFRLADYMSDISIEDTTVNGPKCSIAGKDFNLFSIELGTKLELSKLRSEVSVDTEKKLVKVLLGVNTSGSAGVDGTDGNKLNNAAWSKEYNDFKNLYKQITGLEAKKGNQNGSYWNQFQKLRGKMNSFQCKLMVSASMQASGYLEWSYETGTLTFSEGGLMEAASIGAEVRKNIPQFPLAYVYLKLSADEKGAIVCKATPEGMTTDYSLEPSLTAGIGVGMGKTNGKAKTYIEGHMDAKLGAKITNRDPKLTVNLDGTLYLTAYGLGFELVNESIPCFAMQLYPEQNNRMAAKGVNEVLSYKSLEEACQKAEPLSREYITNKEIQSRQTTAPEVLLEEAGLFPYAMTELVTLSDGRLLLLYIGDTGKKSDRNRTSLCYRIYDDGVWSAEQTIAEDGCFFDGLVTYQSGDTVYIGYQKANETLADSAAMEDVAEAMDLYLVTYDGTTFSEPVMVNEEQNSLMEMGQVLYEEDGTLYTAWLDNSENDMFLTSGTNRLHIRSLEGGQWSEETVLAATEDVIEELQYGSLNGKNSLIYSVSGEEKNKVYCYADGSVKQILTDTKTAGEFTVFDDKLYYLDGGQLYCYDGTTVVNEVGTLGMSNYQLLKVGGQLTLLTNLVTAGGSELYIAEKQDGQWSTLVPYTNQGGYIRDWDAVVKNGDINVAMNRVAYDEASDSYRDASLIVTGESDYYDVGADYVVYDEEKVAPAAQLPVEVGYTNYGKNKVTAVTTTIKDETGAVLASHSKSVTLETLESGTDTLTLTLPQNMKSKKIIAEVSIAQTDADLENNIVENEISYVDLALEQVKLASASGDTITVTGTITNKGLEDLQDINTSVHYNTMQGQLLGEQKLSSLKAGEQKNVTVTLFKSALPSSENQLHGLVVYTECDTIEKNYVNNEDKLIYHASGESNLPDKSDKDTQTDKIPSQMKNTSLQTGDKTAATSSNKARVTAPKRAVIKKLTIKNNRRLKVTFKKVTGAKGYQIAYATNKKFKGQKTVTTRKLSYTLKKLKKNKRYYVRVRAYKLSDGKKVYGKWSVVKKKKTRK